MAEGFGSVSWWGLSPAIDFLSLSCECRPTDAKDDPDSIINILLVGAGDVRHIMRTVSENPNTSFHFYVIESNLEVLARHIMFFSLFCEPQDKVGLREKTELFLELYGNSLLRGHTAQYLKDKANDLIRLVTDPSSEAIPFLELNCLKVSVAMPYYMQYCYGFNRRQLWLLAQGLFQSVHSLQFKERDMLEGIFKFWRNSDKKTFDIEQEWERRLRHYLAQRYDSRKGVYDWDYHMKLQEMVPLIRSDEYLHWRETGVAFHLRDDAPYDISNRTLANGVLVHSRGGDIVGHRGYWGDIVSSPFLAFGSFCKDEEMLKKSNDKYVKSSQEISEYNVSSMLELLLTGSNYLSPSNAHSSIEEVVTDERIGLLFSGRVQITLLPLNSATELGKKLKFGQSFHYAFFSNSMVHHLTTSSGIERTMRKDCLLICDTARFMLDLTKENKEEYLKKVTGMAEAIGFKVEREKDSENILAFTQT